MARTLPRSAQRTLTRRDWMEWLGRSAVLSLGGGLACAPSTGREDARVGADHGGDAPMRLDAGGHSVDGGSDRGAEDSGAAGLTFYPGSAADPVYQRWYERTVDPQDLEPILASWRLRVDGLVDTAATYSFDQLLAAPRHDMVTDFHCVEGWSVYDVPWNGVRLSEILDAAGPHAGATHVTFHTIDSRYNESLPLEVALEPNTTLGFGVGGNTLPLAHGFPLRLVVPRLLGYKNAKYVRRLELTDGPVEGYWVRAGYPYAGEVPDSRLRPGKY